MIGDTKAVIILSGGMDSVTTLAYAIKKGFVCYVLPNRLDVLAN